MFTTDSALNPQLQFDTFPLYLHFSFNVASLHGKSSSTGNLLEREDMAITAPDYNMHPRVAAQSSAPVHGRQQRPYSMAAPGFPQVHTLARRHTGRDVEQNLAKDVLPVFLRRRKGFCFDGASLPVHAATLRRVASAALAYVSRQISSPPPHTVLLKDV